MKNVLNYKHLRNKQNCCWGGGLYTEVVHGVPGRELCSGELSTGWVDGLSMGFFGMSFVLATHCCSGQVLEVLLWLLHDINGEYELLTFSHNTFLAGQHESRSKESTVTACRSLVPRNQKLSGEQRTVPVVLWAVSGGHGAVGRKPVGWQNERGKSKKQRLLWTSRAAVDCPRSVHSVHRPSQEKWSVTVLQSNVNGIHGRSGRPRVERLLGSAPSKQRRFLCRN